MSHPVVIATWPFGRVAVEAAWPLLLAGVPALDAAIAGAQAVEDDPAVNSVGYGGLPDAAGVVTLDACVMDGRTLNCGGVAGVEAVRHVAALARRVMEQTPHVLLVGAGAERFAIEQGFRRESLLTPECLQQWDAIKDRRGIGHGPMPDPTASHDTVVVLARDAAGHVAGACSTSGLAHKRPGRVGDSPLIGVGLYADDEAGAAGGTGVGEEIVRVAGGTLMVEAMRAGLTAQEACERAAERLVAVAKRRGVEVAGVGFLALGRAGDIGAAGTEPAKFQIAVASPAGIELRTAAVVA